MHIINVTIPGDYRIHEKKIEKIEISEFKEKELKRLYR